MNTLYKLNKTSLVCMETSFDEAEASGRGLGMCPYDPWDNATSILIVPQFVGSFDEGNENDLGGGYMSKKKWLSFQKARLNCSLPGRDPFYFDEIYKGEVYDIFMKTFDDKKPMCEERDVWLKTRQQECDRSGAGFVSQKKAIRRQVDL
ncbi:SEM1A-like protein [Mya arenaria]|uniref:SEM1A-like protein n=1 Tax=Mya arenaria TaxID=6604 RepID=A0ABY7DPC1_MYAAR|nr:SEM1A-like protein [Mya arenaria]